MRAAPDRAGWDRVEVGQAPPRAGGPCAARRDGTGPPGRAAS